MWVPIPTYSFSNSSWGRYRKNSSAIGTYCFKFYNDLTLSKNFLAINIPSFWRCIGFLRTKTCITSLIGMISSLLFFLLKWQLGTNKFCLKCFFIRPFVVSGAKIVIKNCSCIISLCRRSKNVFYASPYTVQRGLQKRFNRQKVIPIPWCRNLTCSSSTHNANQIGLSFKSYLLV